MEKDTFLTEGALFRFLQEIYPHSEIIRNKKFLTYRCRPDFVLSKEKIVIEFDGFQHYTKSNVILSDYEKDRIFLKENYTIIRIPYFVQLSEEVVNFLFKKNLKIEQSFRHGFISSKNTMVFPADFCSLGIDRFKKDLEKFFFIKDDIVSSLKEKIKQNNWKLIIPKELKYLI